MPHSAPLDTSTFQLIPLVAEDASYNDLAEETVLLERMRETAEGYIRAFVWAPPIKETLLAFGASEFMALFLVRFEHPTKDDDEELWVVVGDLPAMYFVTDWARLPSEALEAYCELAEDWANAVLSGDDLSEVYPIPYPTPERANMLLKRTNFIRDKIIPDLT